eukprot:g50213.t1
MSQNLLYLCVLLCFCASSPSDRGFALLQKVDCSMAAYIPIPESANPPVLPGQRPKVAKGLMALLLTATGGWTTANLMGATTPPSRRFVPKDDMDNIMVRPGYAGGGTLAGLFPGLFAPNCLFAYGADKDQASASFLKGWSSMEEGWVFGARLEDDWTLAVPTGNKDDVVKGLLLCYTGSLLKSKLTEADQLHKNDKKNPLNSVHRDIVNVIGKEGQATKAYWYYEERAVEKKSLPPRTAPTFDMKFGFSGGGNMARAIIAGLLASKAAKPEEVLVFDTNSNNLAKLQEEYGVLSATSNLELATRCPLVVLAVKPGIIPKVIADMDPVLSDANLLVSIAAGITIKQLESWAPRSRVIRVMPNTPALVQAGASAYAKGSKAREADMQQVKTVLEGIGLAIEVQDQDMQFLLFSEMKTCYIFFSAIAIEVQDKDMDAVTGLSGSGPAYIFVLIEALADGGVKAGLTRPVAQALAIQTVLGGAKLAQETAKHPGQLKDEVASPGGTTIAGLHALESGRFRATVIDAVMASRERSIELG